MDTGNNFKIKLISPGNVKIGKTMHSFTPERPFLPYGMGIITAFLRQHNYYVDQEDLRVKFKDNKNYSFLFRNYWQNTNIDRFDINQAIDIFNSGNFNYKSGKFFDRLIESLSIDNRFNLIGFSNFSYTSFLFSLLMSRRIKQKIKIPIVFGGAFVTLYGHLHPGILDYVDYMVVGDGGVPLLKLIEHMQGKIAISEVPNLRYKNNKKVIANPREDYPIEDLPIPDFDGLPLELYRNNAFDSKVIPYQITRGCAGNCAFCMNKRLNNKVEFKSYDKVISELSQMKQKYKCRLFYFCDAAINNSYEYLGKLCDHFINSRLDILWIVYARVGDSLDKKILQKMKKAGCVKLTIGIESGSDAILRSMGKPYTSEKASQTLREAAEAGIKNNVCLIAGYPYETQKDVKQTIQFIRKNKKYISNLNFYIFVLFYGSLIHLSPERYGVNNFKPIWGTRFAFSFDECRGLEWNQKNKQQLATFRQLQKHYTFLAYFPAVLLILLSSLIEEIKIIYHKIKK